LRSPENDYRYGNVQKNPGNCDADLENAHVPDTGYTVALFHFLAFQETSRLQFNMQNFAYFCTQIAVAVCSIKNFIV